MVVISSEVGSDPLQEA